MSLCEQNERVAATVTSLSDQNQRLGESSTAFSDQQQRLQALDPRDLSLFKRPRVRVKRNYSLSDF